MNPTPAFGHPSPLTWRGGVKSRPRVSTAPNKLNTTDDLHAAVLKTTPSHDVLSTIGRHAGFFLAEPFTDARPG